MQDSPERKMPYLGHLLTTEGLKIDPRKVKAIHEIPEPRQKKMWRASWLRTVSEQLSTWPVGAPLRDLEKSDVLFHWDHPQIWESFPKIKKLLSQARSSSATILW